MPRKATKKVRKAAQSPDRAKPRKTARPVNLAARLAKGETYTSIAASLNVRRETVAAWAASPTIQKELDAIKNESNEEALTLLAMSKPIVVRTLLERATGKRTSKNEEGVEVSIDIETTPAASVSAARTLADLSGLVPPQRVEIVSTTDTETDDELEARIARLQKKALR